MTQYKTDYPFSIAFPPQHMGNVLAEWLSKKGLHQCHVAETEKYAHVTFFFNGGVENQFANEDRELIPSPKVATYDQDPKMSAAGVANRLCERIAGGKYEFLMNNFAPPDMVGHTGVYEAAIQGVAATDAAIGQVWESCKEHGYILFVTADHGYDGRPLKGFKAYSPRNAEEMLNEHGQPKTSHTTNKVPFIMANGPRNWTLEKANGVLGDVAPTILDAMGVEKPNEMSGTSLLKRL